MAIGDRIRLIRNLRGLTQDQLGFLVGFSAKTARIRISQYENESKKPKDKMIDKLAYALGVSKEALTIPDKIDHVVGMMHILFALEDIYGLKISDIDGKLCLTLDVFNRSAYSILGRFDVWHRELEKLEKGEITKEEYDLWRYRYPLVEAERLEARLRELRKSQKDEQ